MKLYVVKNIGETSIWFEMQETLLNNVYEGHYEPATRTFEGMNINGKDHSFFCSDIEMLEVTKQTHPEYFL